MRNLLRARSDRGDAGITLAELVVGMAIMSVFMAMFTSGTLMIYRVVNRSDATSTAQSQVNTAFLRLDKEIRYAAGISVAGAVGADTYVEYLTANTGTPVCTELRLRVSSGQLQRRTWTPGSGPVTPTPWIPLASQVTATQAFTFSAADATYPYQRLRVRLTAQAGAGTAAATRQSDVTFTALNTSLSMSSAAVCTEGRSIP